MLAALQNGIPLHARPFDELGLEFGFTGAELIRAVTDARTRGIVRRFGAVFDTRRLGYRSML